MPRLPPRLVKNPSAGRGRRPRPLAAVVPLSSYRPAAGSRGVWSSARPARLVPGPAAGLRAAIHRPAQPRATGYTDHICTAVAPAGPRSMHRTPPWLAKLSGRLSVPAAGRAARAAGARRPGLLQNPLHRRTGDRLRSIMPVTPRDPCHEALHNPHDYCTHHVRSRLAAHLPAPALRMAHPARLLSAAASRAAGAHQQTHTALLDPSRAGITDSIGSPSPHAHPCHSIKRPRTARTPARQRRLFAPQPPRACYAPFAPAGPRRIEALDSRPGCRQVCVVPLNNRSASSPAIQVAGRRSHHALHSPAPARRPAGRTRVCHAPRSRIIRAAAQRLTRCDARITGLCNDSALALSPPKECSGS